MGVGGVQTPPKGFLFSHSLQSDGSSSGEEEDMPPFSSNGNDSLSLSQASAKPEVWSGTRGFLSPCGSFLLTCFSPAHVFTWHSSSLTDVVSGFFNSSGLRNAGKKASRGIFAGDVARMHSRFRWRSVSAQTQAQFCKSLFSWIAVYLDWEGLFLIIFT